MQIKIIIRYHFTLGSVRSSIIKNSTEDKFWRACGKKGALLQLLVGM